MAARESLLGCVLVCLGCESAPTPPPPKDAFVLYDTQPIPVDRPGTMDDRPGTPPDTTATDTSAADRPASLDRPDRCAPGSFTPCECAPGVLGTRRCVDGGVDPVCRCEGFDGGAGDAMTADVPAGDASGSREHLATLCVACSRPASDCNRLSDCYEGLWQPEVVARYAACRVAAGCPGTDDRCASEALASALPTEESMAFNRQCLMLASVCGPDTTVCNAPSTSAVLPAIRAAYQRCLMGPCGLLRDCFRNARPAACNAG